MLKDLPGRRGFEAGIPEGRDLLESRHGRKAQQRDFAGPCDEEERLLHEADRFERLAGAAVAIRRDPVLGSGFGFVRTGGLGFGYFFQLAAVATGAARLAAEAMLAREHRSD